MPKVRSPNRDKAFEMYKNNNGNIQLISIAEELGETDGTVRGWKSKDKWDLKLNGTFPSKDRGSSKKNRSKNKSSEKKSSFISQQKNNVSIMGTNKDLETDLNRIMQRKRGAPAGNKNAVGNAGGKGAPEGNKYAVTTGEYESIVYGDIYDDNELKILAIDIDKYQRLNYELKALTIRQRRMEMRIKTLSNLEHFNEKTGEKMTLPVQNGLVISSVMSTKKGNVTTTKSALELINQIEDGLTRVNSAIAKVTALIHKMEIDCIRLGYEEERLKAYKNKMKGTIDLDELILDDLGELEE